MDQDSNPIIPNTAGGPDTGNAVPSEPGQNTQTTTNELNATQPQISQPQPQISRPVDSNYIERDLRIPKDKSGKGSSRTPVIIAAIVVALVLIFGGLAIWFFAFYNNPNKVMLDGINNVLNAENVSFNGGGSLMLREGDGSVQSVILNLDSSSSKLPNTTEASLLISFEEGKSINLKLGTVQMNDGVIYLRVSGIMDSLRSMDVSEELKEQSEDLFNALETIDGEWWRISVRELLQDMTEDDKVVDLYSEVYDCALNLSAKDNSQEIANLYKQHKFIEFEPVKSIGTDDGYVDYKAQAWHNLYEIKFDKAALAEFINAVPDTDTAKEMYTCINTAVRKYEPRADEISADDFNEISADDIDIPSQLHLFAEVSQFGHKIRSLWAYADDDDWKNSFAVTLGYEKVEVSAPSEYRNITELFEELPLEDAWWNVSLLGSGYGSGYDYECDDEYCNEYYDDYDFDNYIEEAEWES